MTTASFRRRVRHVESEGRRYERITSSDTNDLDENDPLINGSSNRLSYIDEDDECWKDKGKNPELAWKWNFSQVLVQWSHCFTHVVIGSRSWIGGLLNRSLGRRNGNNVKYVIDLSPIQEERLRKLQSRVQIPFDGTRSDHQMFALVLLTFEMAFNSTLSASRRYHQEALRALWQAAFPGVELQGLVSDQWKNMGWQGPDPSTDFRGGGFISLENLLFFANMFPKSFHRLLFKEEGNRATWEYPFAVAGINVSFMLIQMLDLYSDKPRTQSAINFLRILEVDEMAFDLLYCVAFEMIDAQWLAMRASYMEFNEVMKAAKSQLERELSLEDVNRIQDLPAYNLLFQS